MPEVDVAAQIRMAEKYGYCTDEGGSLVPFDDPRSPLLASEVADLRARGFAPGVIYPPVLEAAL